MDKTTLQSLKAAFAQAPSADLAKVIVLGMLELEDAEECGNYLNALKPGISNEEFSKVAPLLLAHQANEKLIELADEDNAEQALFLAQALLNAEQFERAKNVYAKAIAAKPSLQQAELNEIFAVDARDKSGDDRPKLRVVEKASVTDVTDLVRYKENTANFDDVVGLTDIKKQINKRIILPFQKPSLFQRFKKKVGGGVLLYGPPGCGKTLIARATAGECHASFFNIAVSDVLDMYIGESEHKLHAIFEKARAETPSVLFFDEFEALAGKREHARNATSNNLVSQFLSELDGFTQNNNGMLVLASTNTPWAIDSAFLRPGRFDRMFFVPPPDREARQAILRYHIQGRPAVKNIDFSWLAAGTSGYSGADLENLIDMAADEAIDESIERGEEVMIDSRHFKLAVKESRSTTVDWLTTARNYARYANDGGRYNDVLDFLKKHGN